MKQLILALCISVGCTGPVSAETTRYKSWSKACVDARAVVKEGDLIFLDIPNFLFRRVAEDTLTWTSHVGLVLKDDKGRWVVMESTVPVSRKSSLCEYLKSSSEYKFEIRRRHTPLSESDVEVMRRQAHRLLYRFYNFGFDFEGPGMFCSKYVYLIYLSIGQKVGQVQTLSELFAENSNAHIGFWKLLYGGHIPWKQKTITPASQLIDSHFFTVMRSE